MARVVASPLTQSRSDGGEHWTQKREVEDSAPVPVGPLSNRGTDTKEGKGARGLCDISAGNSLYFAASSPNGPLLGAPRPVVVYIDP